MRDRGLSILSTRVGHEQLKGMVEAVVAAVVNENEWLKGHPPRVAWVFGSQEVETPVDHPLYVMRSGEWRG